MWTALLAIQCFEAASILEITFGPWTYQFDRYLGSVKYARLRTSRLPRDSCASVNRLQNVPDLKMRSRTGLALTEYADHVFGPALQFFADGSSFLLAACERTLRHDTAATLRQHKKTIFIKYTYRN